MQPEVQNLERRNLFRLDTFQRCSETGLASTSRLGAALSLSKGSSAGRRTLAQYAAAAASRDRPVNQGRVQDARQRWTLVSVNKQADLQQRGQQLQQAPMAAF